MRGNVTVLYVLFLVAGEGSHRLAHLSFRLSSGLLVFTFRIYKYSLARQPVSTTNHHHVFQTLHPPRPLSACLFLGGLCPTMVCPASVGRELELNEYSIIVMLLACAPRPRLAAVSSSA